MVRLYRNRWKWWNDFVYFLANKILFENCCSRNDRISYKCRNGVDYSMNISFVYFVWKKNECEVAIFIKQKIVAGCISVVSR